MNKPFEVAMEISGPLAMFARPDTGATPTSYAVPTWSACKGIFESIARLPQYEAYINPVKVEICRRVGEAGGQVRFQRYTTNYGGPLRKSSQISQGGSFQFFATVLADVCYRLYALVEESAPSVRKGRNPCHHLQELFERRIRQGRCHRTPCLGWSEFTASYWGPLRNGARRRSPETEVDESLTLPRIPSLLYSVFDAPTGGHYKPRFMRNVEVTKGVLIFKPPEDMCAD
jgi:CRISPR-associated protein Cas5d